MKVGDIVRFKSTDSKNAEFFGRGLENLQIKAIYSDCLRVYESDMSNSWLVENDEVELQFEDKLQTQEEIKAEITRLQAKLKESNLFVNEYDGNWYLLEVHNDDEIILAVDPLNEWGKENSVIRIYKDSGFDIKIQEEGNCIEIFAQKRS